MKFQDKLNVGYAAPGEISEAGEKDIWAVDLEGGTYLIEVFGASSFSKLTLADPEIEALYLPTDKAIPGSAQDDMDDNREDTSLDPKLVLRVQTRGTYYIQLSGRVPNTGKYEIKVTEINQEPSGVRVVIAPRYTAEYVPGTLTQLFGAGGILKRERKRKAEQIIELAGKLAEIAELSPLADEIMVRANAIIEKLEE